MKEKARARALTRAVVVLLAVGCARTGLEFYAVDGSEEETGGIRNGAGGGLSGGGSGGAIPSGGRGGSSTGARPGREGTGGDGRGGSVGKGGSSGTGGADVGRYCPSVVAPDYDKVVFATILGNELWLYRSSGSGIRVNAVAGAGTQIWRAGDFLFVVNSSPEALIVSLVDRLGNVLWSHRGPTESIEPREYLVNAQGDAAVRTAANGERRGFAILADGTTRELPGPPQAAPDVAGWVPFGSGDAWGFANVRTGSIVRAPLSPSPSGTPFVWHGRLVYLAMDGTRPVISILPPEDRETRVPVPEDLATAFLTETDVGGLITTDWLPRAVLDVAQLTLRGLGPLPRDPSFDAITWTHGDWGIFVEGNVPRYTVNLRTGTTMELVPAPYEPHRSTPLGVLMNDRFAVGLGNSGVPAFRVELETARIDAFRDATPRGLRPFGDDCTQQEAALLDDGRIALGLRDDVHGGIYVGQLHSPDWVLSGLPVTNIESTSVSVRSGAWILSAWAVHDTFCPPESWPTPDPNAIAGDSVQIVLADSEVVYENSRSSDFLFHETGLCAIVGGEAHDFPTTVRTPLPEGATQTTFW